MVISYQSFFFFFFYHFPFMNCFLLVDMENVSKSIASAFLYLFRSQRGKLRLHGNLNLEKWNIPYISVLLTTTITVSHWIISINFIRKKITNAFVLHGRQSYMTRILLSLISSWSYQNKVYLSPKTPHLT